VDTRIKRKKPVRRVALGLFIVWQLAFLAIGNAASFLRYQVESAAEGQARVGRAVAAVTDGWAKLTGQEQNWRMFAPLVPMRALAVQAVFTGDTPPPPAAGEFHWPGSGDRLWHVEKTVAWPMVAYEPAAVAERTDEWRDYLADQVRANGPAYRNYLAWQQRDYLRQHPGLPPPAEGRLGVWVFSRSRQPDSSRPEVFVPLPLEARSNGPPGEAAR